MKKRSGLPSGTIGAITEVIVCADLLKKGFEVFRSVSPHGSCDLVACRNGRIFRIEVKTSHNFEVASARGIELLKRRAVVDIRQEGDTAAYGFHSGHVVYIGPIEQELAEIIDPEFQPE